MTANASHAPLRINDLKRHNAPLGSLLDAALSRVRESGYYILGPEVTQFEQEFAAYCGAAHCVAVGNGTDALEISLRAVGVTPGSQVVSVANASMYATIATLSVGATPLYVDLDPQTLLMSPAALSTLDLRGVRAIVVTHLYGQLADVDAIRKIADAHAIPLIEDCAQAHGARDRVQGAGTRGHTGCFSFYPTKNLGALGDGGAIITGDAAMAQTLRALRQYGWAEKYTVARPGGRNSRLDEIQAAVLRAKLPFLDGWNARRRAISDLYGRLLHHPAVRVPPPCDERSVAHLYVVQTAQRDALREHLRQHDIIAEVHYPIADHHQPGLRDFGPFPALPVCEQACRQVLTLPCFPEMHDEEVQRVCDVINAWRP